MSYDEYQNLPFPTRTNALRNALCSLGGYHFVSFSRERDLHVLNATGEDHAEWEVEIGTRKGTVRHKADHIERAIIEAIDKAEAAEDEAQKARDTARAVALAKLTPEERRLLGVEAS